MTERYAKGSICVICILKGEVEYMSVTVDEERLDSSERPDHSSIPLILAAPSMFLWWRLSSVTEDFTCSVYSASPSVYFVE